MRTSLGHSEHTAVTVEAKLRTTTVHGDPILLDLLVDNLIRNAVRHNIEDGRIWIDMRDDTVSVETGELIDPERLEALGDPFRWGTSGRVRANGGVGLGLAIVTAVARAHRARLDLTTRVGGGIRAEVRFTAQVL